MHTVLCRAGLLFGLLLTLLLTASCGQKHIIHRFPGSVTLYLHEPDAREVLFASSLDRFQYHSANRILWGTWKVSIPADRQFVYFYLVDGKVTLPDCPVTVLDDFGSRNCLYVPDM